MNLTRAAFNALACVHLIGHMPKGIHHATFMAVYDCCDSVPFDVNNWSGPDKTVKPEHVATVEAHPMVVKVRELLAAGWQLDPENRKRRKVNRGIWLIRPGIHRNAETCVWTNGKQGRVWGEPTNEDASLTS